MEEWEELWVGLAYTAQPAPASYVGESEATYLAQMWIYMWMSQEGLSQVASAASS